MIGYNITYKDNQHGEVIDQIRVGSGSGYSVTAYMVKDKTGKINVVKPHEIKTAHKFKTK